MTLTEKQVEKQVEKVTTTKANTGGISGFLVPAISAAVTKGIEVYFMIDLSVEYELLIVSIVTGAVTYVAVWFFPNRPKEA